MPGWGSAVEVAVFIAGGEKALLRGGCTRATENFCTRDTCSFYGVSVCCFLILLWFAKVQRKLWLIAWHMWEHRNNVHHDVHHSIHPCESVAIIGEIIKESQTGLANLNQSLSHLFNGTVQSRLIWTIEMKIQWLISVRRARTQYNESLEMDPPDFDPTVTAVLRRWEKKGRNR